MPNSTLILAASAPPVIAAIGLAAIVRGIRETRGTTLRAPLCWAALAMTALAACETTIALLGAVGTPGAAQLRLAAFSATLLPTIALLGAKQPQSSAWQFIVFSCWLMLALPAGQAWLMRPEYPPAIHPLLSIFAIVITIVGLTNYLPTRFWPAAILAATGQAALNWRFLRWWTTAADQQLSPLVGLGLLTAAAIATVMIGRRPALDGEPIDRLWTDFRNQFGVVWGLRVAERVNAALKSAGHDIVLSWHGFATSYGGSIAVAPAGARLAAETALRSVVRRFTSSEWIDSRLNSDSSQQKTGDTIRQLSA